MTFLLGSNKSIHILNGRTFCMMNWTLFFISFSSLFLLCIKVAFICLMHVLYVRLSYITWYFSAVWFDWHKNYSCTLIWIRCLCVWMIRLWKIHTFREHSIQFETNRKIHFCFPNTPFVLDVAWCFSVERYKCRAHPIRHIGSLDSKYWFINYLRNST